MKNDEEAIDGVRIVDHAMDTAENIAIGVDELTGGYFSRFIGSVVSSVAGTGEKAEGDGEMKPLGNVREFRVRRVNWFNRKTDRCIRIHDDGFARAKPGEAAIRKNLSFSDILSVTVKLGTPSSPVPASTANPSSLRPHGDPALSEEEDFTDSDDDDRTGRALLSGQQHQQQRHSPPHRHHHTTMPHRSRDGAKIGGTETNQGELHGPISESRSKDCETSISSIFGSALATSTSAISLGEAVITVPTVIIVMHGIDTESEYYEFKTKAEAKEFVLCLASRAANHGKKIDVMIEQGKTRDDCNGDTDANQETSKGSADIENDDGPGWNFGGWGLSSAIEGSSSRPSSGDRDGKRQSEEHEIAGERALSLQSTVGNILGEAERMRTNIQNENEELADLDARVRDAEEQAAKFERRAAEL